jgi:hypothetical protein
MDKKSFHEALVDGTMKNEKHIIRDMNKLASVVALGFSAKPEFVPVHGDGEKALFELAMQPWAHVKMGQRGAKLEQ